MFFLLSRNLESQYCFSQISSPLNIAINKNSNQRIHSFWNNFYFSKKNRFESIYEGTEARRTKRVANNNLN